MKLKDLKDGAELAANTYLDTTESGCFDGAMPIYVLNFWYPVGMHRSRGPGAFTQKSSLTSLERILVPLEGGGSGYGHTTGQNKARFERYRGVALYHDLNPNSSLCNS
jgi:hypothetical protein